MLDQNVEPPTPEEILGVLRQHPDQFLAKDEIAQEIAAIRSAHNGTNDLESLRATLQDHLEQMRLREIPGVVFRLLH